MGDNHIQKLTMPKWGLAMTHGKVIDWVVAEGDPVAAGAEIVEVETEKITGAVEAPIGGILRRLVARPGDSIPVGGLLGVLAEPDVNDAEIEQFIEAFQPEEMEETGEDQGEVPEFVEVGGRRLCYLKRGAGDPPVVLLHGFTGNLNNWLFNHAELAKYRTVYALDLPGHGQSSKDVGDGSLGTLVESVRDWMDVIGVSRAHFVGHSMGGAITLALAEQYPERVLSCALICSGGLGPEIDHEYLDCVVEADRRKQLKPQLEKLFADPAQVTRQLVDDVLKFKRLDGVADALRTIAGQLVVDGQQAWMIGDRLQSLAAQIMVIWGAEDRIVPATHAKNLPTAVRVEVLEGCGHMVQMEEAGKVTRLLQEFIASAAEVRR